MPLLAAWLVVLVALAAHPAPALAACCSITSVDPGTGLVKAREAASGRTFEFTVTDAKQRASLRAGQPVEADFGAQMAWVPPSTTRYRISNLSAAGDKGLPAKAGTAAERQALPELEAVLLTLPQIPLEKPQPGKQLKQPASVPGGTEAQGLVVLTSPAIVTRAEVTLSSGNTALLHVPPSVTVPARAKSATFRYDPLPVAEPTTATVTASYRGQTKTASVTILPPAVEAITLDPVQLLWGELASGKVRLSGLGPSDKEIKVALTSSNPATQVPAYVVLKGVYEKQFQVMTRAVAQQSSVVISGSFAGTKRDATPMIDPARLKDFGYPTTPTTSPSSPAIRKASSGPARSA